jgi:hypothetical protein
MSITDASAAGLRVSSASTRAAGSLLLEHWNCGLLLTSAGRGRGGGQSRRRLGRDQDFDHNARVNSCCHGEQQQVPYASVYKEGKSARLREQSRRHELVVPVQIVTNNNGERWDVQVNEGEIAHEGQGLHEGAHGVLTMGPARTHASCGPQASCVCAAMKRQLMAVMAAAAAAAAAAADSSFVTF